MTQSQNGWPDVEDANAPDVANQSQTVKIVRAAQACEGAADAEPPRTLDGHTLDDYLTPDGS